MWRPKDGEGIRDEGLEEVGLGRCLVDIAVKKVARDFVFKGDLTG